MMKNEKPCIHNLALLVLVDSVELKNYINLDQMLTNWTGQFFCKMWSQTRGFFATPATLATHDHDHDHDSDCDNDRELKIVMSEQFHILVMFSHLS